MTGILIVQIVLSIVLALIFLIRPSVTKAVGWKIVAFVGLCALPALCIVGGMNTHMQRSEQTKFCISCHAMENYGKSLYLNDPKYIPAQHFQNHRVPPDMACILPHRLHDLWPYQGQAQGLDPHLHAIRQHAAEPDHDPGWIQERAMLALPCWRQGALRKTPSTRR